MPWEYLYYVATVQLGWSAEQFWDGSLRTLIALRDQHHKAEKQRSRQLAYMTASFISGVDPEEGVVDEKELRKKEFELGNAMW